MSVHSGSDGDETVIRRATLAEVAVSVAADPSFLEDDTPVVSLTISSPMCEMHVWIAEEEIPRLKQVENADWDARGSLRIGRSANAPVFWSSTATTVTLLVGHDDETWDIALTLPLSVLPEIIAEVAAAAVHLERKTDSSAGQSRRSAAAAITPDRQPAPSDSMAVNRQTD